MFPFTDCGECVESVRQNMPSTRIEEKKSKIEFKTKNLSIPMHDTNSKASTLRSLNNCLYWLLCLSPFVKEIVVGALALTRSRQDFTLAHRRRHLLLPRPELRIGRRSPPR